MIGKTAESPRDLIFHSAPVKDRGGKYRLFAIGDNEVMAGGLKVNFIKINEKDPKLFKLYAHLIIDPQRSELDEIHEIDNKLANLLLEHWRETKGTGAYHDSQDFMDFVRKTYKSRPLRPAEAKLVLSSVGMHCIIKDLPLRPTPAIESWSETDPEKRKCPHCHTDIEQTTRGIIEEKEPRDVIRELPWLRAARAEQVEGENVVRRVEMLKEAELGAAAASREYQDLIEARRDSLAGYVENVVSRRAALYPGSETRLYKGEGVQIGWLVGPKGRDLSEFIKAIGTIEVKGIALPRAFIIDEHGVARGLQEVDIETLEKLRTAPREELQANLRFSKLSDVHLKALQEAIPNMPIVPEKVPKSVGRIEPLPPEKAGPTEAKPPEAKPPPPAPAPKRRRRF